MKRLQRGKVCSSSSSSSSHQRPRRLRAPKFFLAISMLALLRTKSPCGIGGATGFSLFPRRHLILSTRYTSQKLESTFTTLDSKRLDSDTTDVPRFTLPSHPNVPIRHVMAPMVAASDYPFRQLLRQPQNGVDLTFTQMLHTNNFCNNVHFQKTHLDLYEAGVIYHPNPNDNDSLLPCQIECLGGSNAKKIPKGPTPEQANGPCMVQLAGNNVNTVVQAAHIIMDHTNGQVTGFDLNCGCPQGIASKGNYGAFLMERDESRVYEILAALRQALPDRIAVSAKIRLPLEENALQRRIERLVETGITFLTIHGRTLKENKTGVGAVHKDQLRLAVQIAHQLQPNFPVIANGGMEHYKDVDDILQYTGCVAAMSSEALLETPNMFQTQSLDMTPRQRIEQQFHFAREYLDICANVIPPLPGVLGVQKVGSFAVVRGHLIKFLFRYLNDHTDMREPLVGNKVVTTIPHAWAFLENLEARYAGMSNDDLMEFQSSYPEASWYRRHRKPNRRVHQRGVQASPPSPSAMLSVEERKKQIKERLGLAQS